MSDSTDSEQENERKRRSSAGSNDPVCPVSHSCGKELLNAVVPTDVDTLFNMLFTDSEFLRKLRAERKTTGFIHSSWEQKPGGTEKTRKVTFTVTLNNVVGPRQAIVTESQVLLPISQPGKLYVIEHEVTNAKIPHADSFYVTAHFCLTRVSSNETKLCVVIDVKYRKSVLGFIKGMIESNTWAGLRDYYSHLERLLQEDCRRNGLRAQSVSGIPTLAGSARKRNGRPRRPAPGIPTHITPARQISTDANIDTTAFTRLVGLLSSYVTERSLIWTVFVPLVIALLLFNAHLYVRMSNIEASRVVLNSDQSSVNPATPKVTTPPSQPVTNPPKYEECLALLEKNERVHGVSSDARNRWKKILGCTVELLNQAKEDLDIEIAVHISKLEDSNEADTKAKMANPSMKNGGTRST